MDEDAQIHSDKFNFMGHTDYIDSQIEGNAIMMMVSESLKVALLTEHIPVSKVSNQITKELVCKKLAQFEKKNGS